MGGNMHGNSFDLPAAIIVPAAATTTALGGSLGLGGENVGADGKNDEETKAPDAYSLLDAGVVVIAVSARGDGAVSDGDHDGPESGEAA